ncbi:hypothetical protein B0H13DRAFT_2428155 [Mycena leptocephala]|nr:hypothetical protein B0H13DRAFT_2428155 [Mycena leptocephala]
MLHDLLADAESFADPTWNSAFYDEVAPYFLDAGCRLRAFSGAGSFSAHVDVPPGASDPTAVLSANGVHFQDNAFDPTAYHQYWGPISPGGRSISIPRVKVGTYRLTVFAAGMFGDFVQDDVVVRAGEATHVSLTWTPESAGRELWRLGVPEKSAGEFRNGNERDERHPNRPPAEYRIYWGAWDFPTQFPTGVNFTIGRSREGVDWDALAAGRWNRRLQLLLKFGFCVRVLTLTQNLRAQRRHCSQMAYGSFSGTSPARLAWTRDFPPSVAQRSQPGPSVGLAMAPQLPRIDGLREARLALVWTDAVADADADVSEYSALTLPFITPPFPILTLLRIPSPVSIVLTFRSQPTPS